MINIGFGKQGTGVIVKENRTQALGTLAAKTPILIGTKLTMAEDFRMLRNELYAICSNLDPANNANLLIGLAHGDLTVAEVEAALEVQGPIDRDDIVVNETVMRPVWFLGSLQRAHTDVTTGTPIPGNIPFLDRETNAQMCISKNRWTYGPAAWNYFIYNLGSNNLVTGAVVQINAKSFGVWVT